MSGMEKGSGRQGNREVQQAVGRVVRCPRCHKKLVVEERIKCPRCKTEIRV